MMYAGGRIGRRLVSFGQIVTPAAAPAGVWTAQGWWRFPGPAVLVRLTLLLPAGVAGVLWVRPVYREAARPAMMYNVPHYAAGLNDYLTGDGLHLALDMRERLDNRYELGVLVQHTGAIDHAYSLTYEIELGGAEHGPGAA